MHTMTSKFFRPALFLRDECESSEEGTIACSCLLPKYCSRDRVIFLATLAGRNDAVSVGPADDNCAIVVSRLGSEEEENA